METLSLALEYPNGRIYECELKLGRELELGDVFELYGRRWRATHVLPPERGRSQTRLLCLSLGPRASGE
jgi:hypothetical protein